MQMVRRLWRGLKWAFISVMSIILVIVVLLSLPSGKKALIHTLNLSLRTADFKVQIAKIDSFLPLHLQIDDITLYSSHKAPWLQIDSLTIKVKPLLRSRTLKVDLSAAHVVFKNMPQDKKEIPAKEQPPTIHLLEKLRQELHTFQLPVNLALTLECNQVDIAPPITKAITEKPTRLAVHQATFTWHRSTREFQLKLPLSFKRVAAKDFSHNNAFLTLTAAGTLPYFQATLQGKASHFTLNNTALHHLKLQAVFQGLPFAPNGTLRGTFHHHNKVGRLQADTIQTDHEILQIKGFQFQGLDTEMISDLTYNFKTHTAKGSCKATSTNLEPLTTLLGLPLHGSATLQGEWGLTETNAVNTHLSLQAHNLEHPDFTLQALSITANLQDLLAVPSGDVAVQMTKGSAADFDIATAQATLALRHGQGDLKFHANGTDLQLNLLTTLNLSQSQQHLTVQKLVLLYQKQPLQLMQPVDIIFSNTTIELFPAKIQVVSVPVDISGKLQDQTIAGKLSGQVDLGLISKLFLYSGDSIDGKATFDLSLSGTMQKPVVNGFAKLRDGSYENIIWGTSLKDIQLDVVAQESKLILKKAVASDGHGGRASLKGHYDLATDNLNMVLRLTNLRIAYTDQLQLVIRQSHLVAQGGLYNLHLTGKATVDSGRYDITKIFLGQIEKLNVITPLTMEANVEQPPVTQGRGLAMTFNVTVDIPPTVKVYGRGLDSIWRGTLQVTETLAAPLLVGDLKLESGNLKFLGQDLQFTDGLITFDGNNQNIPFLAMNAALEQADFKANVTISGRATKPKFSLSSTPSLPQDEIIARLLFGRTSDKLSPFELISLGKAVTDFQSGRTPQSLLGSITDRLGLDTLGVKSGEETTSLQLGKRFFDKVHVHFDQGIKPEDSKAILEIEPTKNITVTTEIGAAANSGGLGLNYSYSY
jgi:Uncharacterized protein conserved in bacteria